MYKGVIGLIRIFKGGGKEETWWYQDISHNTEWEVKGNHIQMYAAIMLYGTNTSSSVCLCVTDVTSTNHV